jgi:hypothetical protein
MHLRTVGDADKAALVCDFHWNAWSDHDDSNSMSSVDGSTDVWLLLQVMNDVYSKFSQCQDNLPLARNEVYVCTLWGQWFFLPAISGLRSKRCGLGFIF